MSNSTRRFSHYSDSNLKMVLSLLQEELPYMRGAEHGEANEDMKTLRDEIAFRQNEVQV